MKNRLAILGLSLFVVISGGCIKEQTPAIIETPALTLSAHSALFIETGSVAAATAAPYIVRSRFVKVNFALLLDETGLPRQLGANSEIALNLFPDVNYIGVIERIESNGDGYSWAGHLKNVEFSELTMLYTAGVFIAHFASPGGVYEVSSAGGDLYQIMMIDQSKLQGGEGDIQSTPTGP